VDERAVAGAVLALVSQLVLVPLQPQPQDLALASVVAAALLDASGFDVWGRTRPAGRTALALWSAALPAVLKAARRARLASRPLLLATAGSGVSFLVAAGLAIEAGLYWAAGLLVLVDFATAVLPCKAIALRRLSANARPERVAVLFVLSVASVITYLEFIRFTEVAATGVAHAAAAS